MEFKDYSEAELIAYIKEEHLNKKKSIRVIAAELKTYPTKIWRFCNKHQIPVMTAGESLKEGYESNRIKPSRAGVKLDKEVKREISETQRARWAAMSEEDREKLSQIHTDNFAKRADKDTFHLKGARAIRKTVKEGSKFEKRLMEFFDLYDIKYIHHYAGIFGNTKLEADFYLPDKNTIIEVDGPGHFSAVFSPEQLEKQRQYDNDKNALVINMGASMIRLKHQKKLYEHHYNTVFDELLYILQIINNEVWVIDVEKD